MVPKTGCLSACHKKKYGILPKAMTTFQEANTCHAKAYYMSPLLLRWHFCLVLLLLTDWKIDIQYL